jgi:hypothetical protein
MVMVHDHVMDGMHIAKPTAMPQWMIPGFSVRVMTSTA